MRTAASASSRLGRVDLSARTGQRQRGFWSRHPFCDSGVGHGCLPMAGQMCRDYIASGAAACEAIGVRRNGAARKCFPWQAERRIKAYRRPWSSWPSKVPNRIVAGAGRPIVADLRRRSCSTTSTTSASSNLPARSPGSAGCRTPDATRDRPFPALRLDGDGRPQDGRRRGDRLRPRGEGLRARPGVVLDHGAARRRRACRGTARGARGDAEDAEGERAAAGRPLRRPRSSSSRSATTRRATPRPC